MATRKLLLLEAPSPDFKASVTSSLTSCHNLKKEIPEAAGFQYFNLLHYQSYGVYFRDIRDPPVEEEEEEVDETKTKEYERKKKKKLKNIKENDYYELLGLGHSRYLATATQIKEAYRQTALVHHPDKQDKTGPAKPEDDEHFKKIQKAYEILSNPRTRKIFDSSDEFDDTLPGEGEGVGEAFYNIYGPVFVRNAKWSNNSKVPSLGDSKTNIDDVLRFYDFWRRFDSWRDFSHNNEYDPEEAESRDEKRWMERMNRKNTEKLRKDERARINRLVDMAYKKDPRVINYEQELENEKNRIKEERRKERERKEKEREAWEKEQAEKKQKELEEKKLAEQKLRKETSNAKVLLKKRRAKLRQAITKAKETGENYSEEELNQILTYSPSERVSSLVRAFSSSPQEARTAWANEVATISELQKQKQKTDVSEDRSKQATPWTDDELSALAKGVQKFPAGYRNRWEVIAEWMGSSRPVKEIIAKAKTINDMEKPVEIMKDEQTEYMRSRAAKKQAKKQITEEMSKRSDFVVNELPQEVLWSQEEQDQLERALETIPLGTPLRWDQVADRIATKSKKEIVNRYRFILNHIKAMKLMGKIE